MTSDPVAREFNVLFLCVDNSAHSLMAECVLNRLGLGRFNAFSAGNAPSKSFNDCALHLLRHLGYAIERRRPMSWREFAWCGAPRLDLVIHLCDRVLVPATRGWIGNPRELIWNLSAEERIDATPALRVHALRSLFRMIEQRASILVNLPDPMVHRIIGATDRSVFQVPAAPLEIGPDASLLRRSGRQGVNRRRASDRRLSAAA